MHRYRVISLHTSLNAIVLHTYSLQSVYVAYSPQCNCLARWIRGLVSENIFDRRHTLCLIIDNELAFGNATECYTFHDCRGAFL